MKGKHFSWITVWLIVVCVLLVVSGSYAAYSSVQYIKGVGVAKAEKTDLPFSSNYLTLCGRGNADPPERMVSVSTGNPVSVSVTVCNYPQNDRLKFHKTDISYTLEATLLDANGAALPDLISYLDGDGNPQTIDKAALISCFQLKLNNEDNKSFTTDANGNVTCGPINASLSGGAANWNVHVLQCTAPDGIDAASLMNLVSIQMKVTPTCGDSCLASSQLLGRLKVVAVDRSDQQWDGNFVEDLSNLAAVDALNYVLSGTAEETITLQWDPNVITLSQWSKKDLESLTTASSDGSITIHVGGEGNPTSYRLQFYWTKGIPSKSSTIDISRETRPAEG